MTNLWTEMTDDQSEVVNGGWSKHYYSPTYYKPAKKVVVVKVVKVIVKVVEHKPAPVYHAPKKEYCDKPKYDSYSHC